MKNRITFLMGALLFSPGCGWQESSPIQSASAPAGQEQARPSVNLVRPEKDLEVDPREKIPCVCELRIAGGSEPPQVVIFGIRRGQLSVTKSGQKVADPGPDGAYRCEATLIAPQEPGVYTLKATAMRFHDDAVEKIDSREVRVTVKKESTEAR